MELQKILVVGGTPAFVYGSFSARLSRRGLVVGAHLTPDLCGPATKLPAGMAAVVALDFTSPTKSNTLRRLAEEAGLPFTHASRKWKVTEANLLTAGILLDPTTEKNMQKSTTAKTPAPPLPPKPRLYTVAEAAEALGISIYTLYQKRTEGRIKMNPVEVRQTTKDGRTRRLEVLHISEEELNRYQAGNRHTCQACHQPRATPAPTQPAAAPVKAGNARAEFSDAAFRYATELALEIRARDTKSNQAEIDLLNHRIQNLDKELTAVRQENATLQQRLKVAAERAAAQKNKIQSYVEKVLLDAGARRWTALK